MTANGWITDVLVLLPFLGALVVWLLPLPRVAAGTFALVFCALEIAFWAGAMASFDFGVSGAQMQSRMSWFSDLHASWHVGYHGFALWLVGLTAVAMTAAIAYGFRERRDRPRVYFGLMLFLLGAIVGVFSSLDLLLFYVFWEAMLIPLYLLVGVWGGPGRMRATITFVIYTMAGSLLMLGAVIAYGFTYHTFDLVGPTVSNNLWIFLGFAAAFAVKAPLFPLHGWLPDAYREAPPEVAGILSGVVSKTAVYGFLFIGFYHFDKPIADMRNAILALAAAGLIYGSLLAFRARDVRGVIAYSSLAQLGLITIGIFASNLSGFDGAILQMVNHGLISLTLFLLAAVIERRTETGRLERLGGLARGRPVLATVLMTTGIIALAVPGSTAFAGEFLILAGVFVVGWGWAVAGAIAIVLAAMYMLRLIAAVLHGPPGPAAADAGRDLRGVDFAIIVPLVACLLALSAWPASVTDRTFGVPKDTPALQIVR